jgi:hypothetical protein
MERLCSVLNVRDGLVPASIGNHLRHDLNSQQISGFSV